MHEIELLPHQAEALQSKFKYTLLLGGIGSGKTWTGVHWLLKKVKESPNGLGFVGAMTYGQLRNSTLAAVFNELSFLGIDFKYNQSSGMLQIGEKRFLCKSLESYDVLRGIEISEMWLDEASFLKVEAWNVMIGRLRDKNGKLDALLTTSPNGFNWCYDYFHPDGEKHNKDFGLVKARSKDNVFLPEGYLDSLYSEYNSKQIQQELEAEFVNISTGAIYWAFDRDKHVQEFDPEKVVRDFGNYPLHGGTDFNVDPMTTCMAFVRGDMIYVFDEFFLKDSNTERLAKRINSRYGSDGITLYADASGKARKTSSSTTDYLILKQHGFRVRGSRNPFRVDRYNTVNAALEKCKVVIHPKCKMLIRDLEQVSYKEGTNDPDTTNKELTHMSDALGYLLTHLAPMRGRSDKPVATFR